MIRREIVKLIEKATGQKNIHLERPKNPAHGDYSTNIALRLKKPPQEIIEKLRYSIQNTRYNIFERMEAAGPGFINFWVSKEALEKLFSKALKGGTRVFRGEARRKKTIVVEYSSPNIAKPLGVHHLRSTVIGQALVNVLRFYGHKVISLSFPGDWGTQFGLLIAAYKRWGDREKLKKDPIAEMLGLYVRFSKAAKEDLKLLEEGRQEFKKLEQGDPENRKIWRWFAQESYKDFNRVYKLLGVKIENTIGESFYEKELKKLVRDALSKGLAEYGEDHSVIVRLPGSETPEIIQKSDGATIYTTRELAAIRHRLKKWKAAKIVYVAANQQAFHLAQVFAVAEKMGIAKKNQLLHAKFGMMLGPGGKKFATREGKLIPLQEVLKEAISRARTLVEKLNPSLPERVKEKIAHQTGIGAVKFFDLSRNRESDIVFDWNNILNLKGFSAPYIQYTHARLCSILRKANHSKNAGIFITHPKEREAVFAILLFDEIIKETALNLLPNKLAEYLYELSNILNHFYEQLPVLKAEKRQCRSRLNVIWFAREILREGLALLGIPAPAVM